MALHTTPKAYCPGVGTIWNRAATELTGTDDQQAIGRQWRDVLGLAISASLNAPIPPTTFGVFRM